LINRKKDNFDQVKFEQVTLDVLKFDLVIIYLYYKMTIFDTAVFDKVRPSLNNRHNAEQLQMQ